MTIRTIKIVKGRELAACEWFDSGVLEDKFFTVESLMKVEGE